MASKRKRKLEKKSSTEFQEKMKARRASANDALWTYGLPLVVILVVGLGIYFAFFYDLGDPKAEKWELEDPQSGEIYASEDYYNDGLTIVEFFNTQCGHCRDQAPVLNEVYSNYSSQINMFAIGGYKLGSGQDSASSISNFKVNYNMQFPHLYDPSGDLMRDYGFSSYPSIAFIKDGQIVYSHSGKLTESQLSAQIENYL
ncbi:MAG: hypothetical protein CMB27_01010 [Euryarchaeota archaeon]|nr:hypothetical protein [Euryarchaeota archaeon]|tara:strand:- start:5752 stop:6351 length:600 start_codon:yes stop_codon:yes gene_type:complete